MATGCMVDELVPLRIECRRGDREAGIDTLLVSNRRPPTDRDHTPRY
jgi:hypothetical protein